MALRRLILIAALCGAAGLAAMTAAPAAATGAPARAAHSAAHSAPALLIENAGQFAAPVRFQAWGTHGTVWLTDAGVVWNHPSGTPVTLTVVGAESGATIAPHAPQATRITYLNGPPDRRRADVPVWGSVRYSGLLPGVDVTWRGEPGRLAARVHRTDGGGRLLLALDGATVTGWHGDTVTVLADGSAQALPLRLSQRDFAIAGYRSAPRWAAALAQLRLDVARLAQPYAPPAPTATAAFSTLLGSGGNDEVRAVARDGAGNVYVTGFAELGNFPVTGGAYDTTHGGDLDAFVAKLSADGSQLLYATFLGGSLSDRGYDLAVDAAGRATVLGWTQSAEFPTTPGTYDTDYNGGEWDIFVTQLNAAGNGLTFSTFLGGSGSDRGIALVPAPTGDFVISGWTKSADFPVTPGAYDTTYAGEWDMIVARLAADGSALTAATFAGGTGGEVVRALALDGAGAPYVTGYTDSADFPATPGAYDTSYNGAYDIFLAKFTPDLSGLVFATYLGSAQDDRSEGVAVNAAGEAFIAGTTESPTFPTTPDAYDTTFNGTSDVTATRFSVDGSSLLYSTLLGAGAPDYAAAVWLTGDDLFITGYTASADFPMLYGAYDNSFGGAYDAFVARLDGSGSDLTYATFVGGSGVDVGQRLLVDGADVIVVGGTDSADFPTTPGAFDGTPNGYDDTFITRFTIDATDYLLYVSFDGDGSVGGVPFGDEDILLYDSAADSWSLYFDGSDVGLAAANVNALLFYSGKLVLSFHEPTTVPGLTGTVQPGDLVLFTPTSLGDETAGTFAWALDGSDVQLTDGVVDISAIAATPDNKLVIATGAYLKLNGVYFRQEDLLRLDNAQYGSNSSGTWAFYFDGTDVELGKVPEKLTGAWIDRATGDIYLNTQGEFNLAGLSGDGSDIFVCTPVSTGNTTICRYRFFWDGSRHGVSGVGLDAFSLRFVVNGQPQPDTLRLPGLPTR